MFIGHYGVGFALKRAAPRASLGWLIAATSFLDLLWPILVLAGVEVVRIDPGNTVLTPLDFVSYPYSHSLLLVCVWGAVLGGFYFLRARYRAGALAVGFGVVSHWFLDLLVHRPDLPLYPGGVRVGLELWNSPVAAVGVESAIFAIGLWTYLRVTRAANAIGRWALWAFVALLAILYVANLAGPPPPGPTAVAGAGLLTWLFPIWAWWIDRNRATSSTEAVATAPTARPAVRSRS